jgi:hypothetical protein
MLVTFSSKAGASVLMLSEHAQPIMRITGKIMDKEIPVRGVFTPEQLAEAIVSLEQAISQEKPLAKNDDEDELPRDALSLHVGLRQRAHPLLELMRQAKQAGQPVLWEAGSGW